MTESSRPPQRFVVLASVVIGIAIAIVVLLHFFTSVRDDRLIGMLTVLVPLQILLSLYIVFYVARPNWRATVVRWSARIGGIGIGLLAAGWLLYLAGWYGFYAQDAFVVRISEVGYCAGLRDLEQALSAQDFVADVQPRPAPITRILNLAVDLDRLTHYDIAIADLDVALTALATRHIMTRDNGRYLLSFSGCRAADEVLRVRHALESLALRGKRVPASMLGQLHLTRLPPDPAFGSHYREFVVRLVSRSDYDRAIDFVASTLTTRDGNAYTPPGLLYEIVPIDADLEKG